MPKKICGVLLAAGAAARFGEQKLLYPFRNGENILTVSAATLKSAVPDCIAVVQNTSDEISRTLVNLGYELVVNSKHELGMGSSIQCGVSHCDADAWVIALADMPLIQVDTIITIIRHLEEGKKWSLRFTSNKEGIL